MKSSSFLTVALSSTTAVLASFNCKFELAGQSYDLTKLGGFHKVNHSESTPPTTTNSTFYINPCGHLDLTKLPKDAQCPEGTEICGVERIFTKDNTEGILAKVIPIAGDLDGQQSGAKTTKLEGKDGVKVEYSGGKYGGKDDLGAAIDFECDKSSEKIEYVGFDGSLLKLRWRTKEICKKDSKDPPPEKKPDNDKGDKPKDGDKDNDKQKEPVKDDGSSWGFFSWLFFIIVLAIAGYIIASAWVNYNRYGLTGVDMLPHSETVRDTPYLIRDFVRKVIGTFSGSSGSRGGYSAV